MSVPVFEVGPIDHTIVYSFAVGFILAWLIFGIRILVLKSRSKKAIRGLKHTLTSRIDLDSESIDRMRKEIELLRKKNANLQSSISNLSQKSGRKENLQLRIYQDAVEKMSLQAPGFAPAWQIVLRECEEENGRSLDGSKVFTKRITPAAGSGWITDAGSREPREARSAETVIEHDSQLSGSPSAGASAKPEKAAKQGLLAKLRNR